VEDNDADGRETAEAKAELAKKQEEELLAKSKDVSLLLQHSKLKKLAEARQVRAKIVTITLTYPEIYFSAYCN
jgi:hypothetical protein